MTRRVLCFGELLLRLGAPGRELLLQSPLLQVQIGGAEANVAVSLARFGHHAAMVGTVAGNALGDAALAALRGHGVDVGRVRRDPGARMGLYFLATGAGLRPSEVVYDRAESAFARAGSDAYDWPALVAEFDCLHVSGITPALGERAAEAVRRSMLAAREQGEDGPLTLAAKLGLGVYDKSGIVELARGLHELGWELLSSGGTAKAVAEAAERDRDVVVSGMDLLGVLNPSSEATGYGCHSGRTEG